MKALTISIILIVGMGFSSSTVWATGVKAGLNDHVTPSMQAWSADEHMALAKSSKEKFENLETEIQQLQAKIDRFTKKPYLDTKGFKRQGLKLWRGKLLNELNQIASKIVWHETQAKEIVISQDGNQQNS